VGSERVGHHEHAEDRHDHIPMSGRRAKEPLRAGTQSAPIGAVCSRCGYNVTINMAIDTVGVRELKDNLSRYLARVRDGGEIVVTEHGRPVARVIGVRGKTSSERLAELVAGGHITPAAQKRRGAPRPVELPGRATVSDLVKDQRR
jgi:prevent-host-death family protein